MGVNPVALHPMQPLHDAAGWLSLLGWVNIIMGVLYCLSIVGIIVAWIFIWQGILLKGAAEKLKGGFASGDNGQLHEASRNVSTYFIIMGILALIGLIFMALYALFVIFMFATVGFQMFR